MQHASTNAANRAPDGVHDRASIHAIDGGTNCDAHQAVQLAVHPAVDPAVHRSVARTTKSCTPLVALCLALFAATLMTPGCGRDTSAPVAPNAGNAPSASSATSTPSTTGPAATTTTAATGSTAPSTPPGPTPAVSTPAVSTPPVASASPEIFATFVQSSGSIRVRLATKEAPRLSMSFINLAERGYFNGRPWTDFSPVVRQTGDSAPLYTLPREFSPKLLLDVGGRLCASNTSEDHTARAKPNRIFLTVKEQDRWNLVYCVFGTVTDGLELARTMRDGEVIESVRIDGDASALRARFAKELVEWNAAIDARMNRGASKPAGPDPASSSR